MDENEEIGIYRVVITGIDEVIGMLSRIATGDDMRGKPAVSLAAGWVSGMALSEKERLRRLIDQAEAE